MRCPATQHECCNEASDESATETALNAERRGESTDDPANRGPD